MKVIFTQDVAGSGKKGEVRKLRTLMQETAL